MTHKNALRRYKIEGLCQRCGKIKENIEKSCCDSCLQKTKDYLKTETGKKKHATARSYRGKSPYGIWRRIKDTAKQRGLEFDLTEEDIIIPTHCPLLNIPLDFNGSRYNSPSLDRIDNTKGYVKGNVWVISELANRMKNGATIEQLLTFAKNINYIFGSD